MTEHKGGFWHNLDLSALLTFIGIVLLFSGAVIVTLIAPNFVDPTWTMPTTPYQVQMYTVSDPNVYISSTPQDPDELQAVYHIKEGYTLLAFQETETVRLVAEPSLRRYITEYGKDHLLLTSRLLLLRKPEAGEKGAFDAKNEAEALEKRLQEHWRQGHSEEEIMPAFNVWEVFAPGRQEAFALAPTDGSLENWVDKDFSVVEGADTVPYDISAGTIFINDPIEYRIRKYDFYGKEVWRYDPRGAEIASLEEMTGAAMGFRSRQKLIQRGEKAFAEEGCWYCHTDQTRTLIQDTVLNGSDSYPAPPSSPNEYIFNEVTFPGTHRIGPDLSRTGIKRPSRDWHKSHFWSPKTESKGSIMPSFQHFFDDDPRGTGQRSSGVPNERFEELFQYLMTKGTRITPPTEAWWLGRDPLHTKEIIEGRYALPKP